MQQPLVAEEKGLHATLTLRHQVRPVIIQVHTLLDGTPVLTRWLSITNTGARPAALSAAFPWSGLLQTTPRWRAHLPEGQPLYEVGYMANTRWGDEGHFQWQPLPNAGYRIDGRYRRDRHRHPFFVLRNNATGEHFVCQLAWSGGYSFEFDLDADLGKHGGEARLAFRLGPDAPAPLRLIDPGETVHTPEVHLGLVFGDLDSAVQAMHDHLRRSVFLPQPRGRGGWVEGGLEPQGWGVLELASRDRERGIAGLFQLSGAQEPEYLFRPRGLDRSRRYRLTFDNSGQRCEVDGFSLVNEGIQVRLAGPLTSELLLFEAVEP